MLEFQLPSGFLDGEPSSWYAVVRQEELRPPSYDGVPRRAQQDAESRILILEAGGDTDVFVSEYAEDLGYVTDTWYPSREAAAEDVEARFGDQLGSWAAVPDTENRAESYVLRTVSAPPV